MGGNSFNLIDSPWIPIVGRGRVSLKDVFSDDSIGHIDGTAIQKISILKLLIAIAEAAVLYEDNAQWKREGVEGLSRHVLAYLEEKHDCFWLHGDKPFLQMPILAELKGAQIKEIPYVYVPGPASDNDSIIRNVQRARNLDDADMTLMLVQVMSHALGGKSVSNTPPLTPGYIGKTKSARPGPSMGDEGYLQCCLQGDSLRRSVWLNYFTKDDILALKPSAQLDVRPPWEEMPTGEDDIYARRLKASVYAWLVSVCRFVLIEEGGIRYVEGLQYEKSVKEGYFDPFITLDRAKGSALNCDTAKKPWRVLPSLLQAAYDDSPSGFSCSTMALFFDRAVRACTSITVWAGGVSVPKSNFDQKVKGNGDFVESLVTLDSIVDYNDFYTLLCEGTRRFDGLASSLRKAVWTYADKMKISENVLPKKAESMFWRVADACSHDFIGACCEGKDELDAFMRSMMSKAYDVYDQVCPHAGARQMLAWMNNRRLSYGVKNDKL